MTDDSTSTDISTTFDSVEAVVEAAPPPVSDVVEMTTFDDVEPSETPKSVEEAPPAEEIAAAPVKDEAEVQAEAVKNAPLKFKVGPKGKEVELPRDTKISIPVDGKEEEFTLQELMNLKSGERSYDRRFTEMDKREKAFKSDRELVESQLDSVLAKVISHNDAGGALLELTRIAGIDPAPLYTALQAEIIGDLNKFMGMDAVERKSYLLEKENSFLKRNEKSLSDRRNDEQAQAELNRQAVEMKEALGVTDEWMNKAEESFQTSPDLHKDWLKGKAPTATQKVELAEAYQRHDMTIRVLTEVDPELAKDPTIIEIGMKKLKEVPGISFEEAIAGARELFKRPAPVAAAPVVSPKADKKAAEADLSAKILQTRQVADGEDVSTTAKPVKEANDDRSYFDWDAV